MTPLWNASFRRTTQAIILSLLITATAVVGAQTGGEEPPPIFLTGNLTLRTIPVGAEVFLNGTFVGTTPLDLSEIRPGRRRIQLEYRGYRSVERWITIPAGGTTVLEETLEPELRTVIVSDPSVSPPVELYLNGRWIPTNRVRLRPGRHSVQVRAFGYRTTTIQLDVPPVSATSNDDEAIPSVITLEAIKHPTVEVALIGRPALPGGTDRSISIPLSITTDAPQPITVVVLTSGATELYRTTITPNGRSIEVEIGPFGLPATVDGESPLTVRVFDDHTSINTPLFNDIVVPITSQRAVVAPIYRSGFGTPLFPTPFDEHRSRVSAVLGGGLIARDMTDDTTLFLPGFLRFGWRPWGVGYLTAGGRVRPGSDSGEPKGDFSSSIGIGGAVSQRFRLSGNVAGRVDDTFSDERNAVIEGIGTGMIRLNAFDAVLVAGVEHDYTRGATRPTIGTAVRYHFRDSAVSLSSKVFLTRRNNRDLPLEHVAFDIQTPFGGAVFLQGSVGLSRFPTRIDMNADLGVGYSIGSAASISTYTR